MHISDDGGANWSLLEFVGPGGNEVSGNWITRSFVVADIPGIENTDQLRVRFRAQDTVGASTVEAGVDSVEVGTHCLGGQS